MNAMRGLPGLVIVVAVGLAVLLLVQAGRGGTAPVPPAFTAAVPLDEAIRRSSSEHRPVLVFATADWCGPCQTLKRGALVSERVDRLIRGGTIPVYADVTGPDAVSMAAAERLGVRAVPALIMLWNGREIARTEGVVSASALESWLTEAIARTGAPVTPGG